MAEEPIKVGGPYQEREDFVPNPTDMVKQYNTSGVGAHGRIEEVSHVFEVDRVNVAREAKGALDPEDDTVSASRVLLPEGVLSNEEAREDLLARADKRLDKGVVIGEATPAEREAALEGDEGVRAARQVESDNASANSTGDRSGTHTPDVKTENEQKTEDDKSEATRTTTAKKTASAPKQGDKS